MASCVCGKDKSFAKCCGRFLSGKEYAKTPEKLMRSRFSAYALGGHGEYLLSTWFPATAGGLTELALSQKTVNWQTLQVIAYSQKGDKGTVEFKAWFYELSDYENIKVMHEVSEFVRVNSRWFYVGGKVDGEKQ